MENRNYNAEGFGQTLHGRSSIRKLPQLISSSHCFADGFNYRTPITTLSLWAKSNPLTLWNKKDIPCANLSNFGHNGDYPFVTNRSACLAVWKQHFADILRLASGQGSNWRNQKDSSQPRAWGQFIICVRRSWDTSNRFDHLPRFPRTTVSTQSRRGAFWSLWCQFRPFLVFAIP
jgi:hypothetical protein